MEEKKKPRKEERKKSNPNNVLKVMKELDIIKEVPIVDILERLGYTGNRAGAEVMYLAPWRNEKHPSLCVTPKRNLWCDFGEGLNGGSNLDLVMRLGLAHNIDQAADWISDHFLAGMPIEELKLLRENASRPRAAKEYVLWVVSAEEITSPALLKFARKRGIQEKTLKMFCKEVVFANRNESNATQYGIGMQNVAGGWAIRTTKLKKSVHPGHVSIMRGEHSYACILFEGMFDFLSYAEEYGDLPCDIVILNSTSNKKKAISILDKYAEIDGYLDNDKAGDEATLYFKDKFNDKFTDMRGHFKGFNDYNEYHLSMLKQTK